VNIYRDNTSLFAFSTVNSFEDLQVAVLVEKNYSINSSWPYRALLQLRLALGVRHVSIQS